MTKSNRSAHEQLSLGCDTWLDYLKNRAFVHSLDGFIPHSIASKGISIDPEIDIEKIVSLFSGYDLFWRNCKGHHQELVFRKDGHLVSATVRAGHVSLEILSRAFNSDKILESLVKLLDPYRFQNQEEDGVWAEFSYMSKHGVVQTTQFLRCPAWTDVRQNYPDQVQGPLNRLFQTQKPSQHGRLIIWHGSPGTGKTFAIRALMMQWRDRFDFVVVTDPERLASDPGYYYEVASEASDLPRRHLEELRILQDESGDLEGDRELRKKRRLFILEDTADLILQESRSNHFDKIGKLLNMTDGLFGQGREDVFLLTFNEDVDKIDPAFLRPGRCIAKIEFSAFGSAEAARWLRAHGVENANGDQTTLAELYAKLLGAEQAEACQGDMTPAVGFSRRRQE